MFGAVAPDVEVVGDSLGVEQAGEAAVFVYQKIAFADSHDDALGAVAFQALLVGEGGDVVGRVLLKDRLVEIRSQEAADVEGAAERDATAEDIGETEREIHGVIAAEAGSGGAEGSVGIPLTDERDHFLHQVSLILLLEFHFAGGTAALVVPTDGIDGVHAEQLNPAVFETRAQDVRHVAMLPLEVTPARSWEDQERFSGVAKNKDLHLAAQRAAAPLNMLSCQGNPKVLIREGPRRQERPSVDSRISETVRLEGDVNLKAVIRILACFMLTALAFAQDTPEKPTAESKVIVRSTPDTPPTEKAVMERAAQFFQFYVNAKFRLAEGLVSEDAKDTFYAEEKVHYLKCEIGKTTLVDNGTKATVVTTCVRPWPFHGQRVNSSVPVTTFWRLENGNWFWYPAPQTDAMTPFGVMKAPAEGSHQAAIPVNPGAATPGMLSGVRASKGVVKMTAGKAAHDTVEIENGMPGVVSLAVGVVKIPGFKLTLDRTRLGPKEKAILNVDYDATTPNPPATFNILVYVQPTGQKIPLRFDFTTLTKP